MPPSPPAESAPSLAPAVARQRQHSPDHDRRAGDGATGDQRPPSEAPLGRRRGVVGAGDDVLAVEGGLHLVDVGGRRTDHGRAAAQEVRRVGRPTQRDGIAGSDGGQLVVGVDVGDHLGPVAELDDEPALGPLEDHVGDDSGEAAPVAARSGGRTETFRSQHHGDRIADVGQRRAADLDEHVVVEADERPRAIDRLQRPGQQVGRPDEAGDEDARRGGVDLLRRPDLLDLTAAHDGDAVAHRQCLALVVGDEDERDADLTLDPLQLDLHRLAQLEVEGGQRFVEQQRARQVDERPGEGDALLLAPGELRRAAVGELAEADDVEHLERPAAHLVGGDLLGPQTEGDVVVHRHVREQRVLLEDGVDVALVGWDGGDVDTLEQHAAGRRAFEPGDHLQQRGLAAAGRAEQREELTPPDGEVGPFDGDEGAELLAHSVEHDDGVRVPAVGGRRPIPGCSADTVSVATGGVQRRPGPARSLPLPIVRPRDRTCQLWMLAITCLIRV